MEIIIEMSWVVQWIGDTEGDVEESLPERENGKRSSFGKQTFAIWSSPVALKQAAKIFLAKSVVLLSPFSLSGKFNPSATC